MMITLHPAYPTAQHAHAAEAVTGLFANDPAVDAVLLVNSCARGKASRDSCLDMLVLSRPDLDPHERERLEQVWRAHYPVDPVYQELLATGSYSHIDLEFVDGVFRASDFYHGWTSGADEFELAVGNTLAYSVPLWQCGTYYQELRAAWLPYYGEDLRKERLAMVLRYCRNNLAHIPLFAPRGLYFQSFKRLYHAFEEFLQALFIARRTYPIAYDKWVKEEVVEILGLPELYERLPRLLEIHQFESGEVVEKARDL
ncbi:MAG TPA: hypothetical protein VF806_01380, partial [Anaerolineaceae bacterium]